MAKVFASLAIGALAQNATVENPMMKGFRHLPTNAKIGVATITDKMRKAAPAKLDWTGRATTSIKNQGNCGSCWAYSVTEGVESGLFMKTGKIVELSPQQIISCDKGDGGCNGGDVDTGMEYVDRAGGLATVKAYPESSNHGGKNGQCKSKPKKVKVTNYKWAIPDCTSNSCNGQKESDLKAALHQFGPLSICLDASWGGYKSGVFTKTCSHKYNAADHCVQLVGYDTTGSQPYWKVRNSWASSWGEKGHIRLPMGQNACGLANWPMMVEAEMVSSDEEVVV